MNNQEHNKQLPVPLEDESTVAIYSGNSRTPAHNFSVYVYAELSAIAAPALLCTLTYWILTVIRNQAPGLSLSFWIASTVSHAVGAAVIGLVSGIIAICIKLVSPQARSGLVLGVCSVAPALFFEGLNWSQHHHTLPFDNMWLFNFVTLYGLASVIGAFAVIWTVQRFGITSRHLLDNTKALQNQLDLQ